MSDLERVYTIGVDFGTLSGRAVVVRVSDGAELGSRRARIRRRRDRHPAARHREPLPPDWALQNPADWIAWCCKRGAGGDAASGVDRADVIAIGTDFTACTVLPTDADGTPLCQLAAWPTGRTPGRSCGSTTPPSRRPTGSTRWRTTASEPWIGRYGGKISARMGVRQGAAGAGGGPRGLRARPRAGSRRRTGSCGSSPARRRATPAPPDTRASSRTAAIPTREYLAALNPAFARLRGDQAGPSAVPARRRRPGASPTQAAGWTGLAEGTVVAVGNVDAHVSAPAAGAVEPGQMLAGHGHLHVSCDDGDRLAEVPGMCGVVDGGIVAGSVRLRGRAERRRRHLRLVGRATPSRPSTAPRRRRAGCRVHAVPDRTRRRRAGRRARADRAGLDQRQPVGARGPRTVRRSSSG